METEYRFSLLCYSGCPSSSGLLHWMEKIDLIRALDLDDNFVKKAFFCKGLQVNINSVKLLDFNYVQDI